MDNDSYEAVVQSVISKGKHGPYAVALVDGIGSVTFALTPPTWNEKRLPDRGTSVVLSELTRKRAGWRASVARFFKPSDEKKH